jgi:hypothetical protein
VQNNDFKTDFFEEAGDGLAGPVFSAMNDEDFARGYIVTLLDDL